MKNIISNLFAICLFCGFAHAQDAKESNRIAQLQILLQQTRPDQPTSVHILAEKRALQIGDMIVPLAKSTMVGREKEGGKHQVKFFLQNGTNITKGSDPNFRQAYWAISLPDKKACANLWLCSGSYKWMTDRLYLAGPLVALSLPAQSR